MAVLAVSLRFTCQKCGHVTTVDTDICDDPGLKAPAKIRLTTHCAQCGILLDQEYVGLEEVVAGKGTMLPPAAVPVPVPPKPREVPVAGTPLN